MLKSSLSNKSISLNPAGDPTAGKKRLIVPQRTKIDSSSDDDGIAVFVDGQSTTSLVHRKKRGRQTNNSSVAEDGRRKSGSNQCDDERLTNRQSNPSCKSSDAVRKVRKKCRVETPEKQASRRKKIESDDDEDFDEDFDYNDEDEEDDYGYVDNDSSESDVCDDQYEIEADEDEEGVLKIEKIYACRWRKSEEEKELLFEQNSSFPAAIGVGKEVQCVTRSSSLALPLASQTEIGTAEFKVKLTSSSDSLNEAAPTCLSPCVQSLGLDESHLINLASTDSQYPIGSDKPALKGQMEYLIKFEGVSFRNLQWKTKAELVKKKNDAADLKIQYFIRKTSQGNPDAEIELPGRSQQIKFWYICFELVVIGAGQYLLLIEHGLFYIDV